MEDAIYSVYVDWDGDGDFLDAGEDVSADFVSASISRGFSDPLARVAQTGRATIVLNNLSRQYSPPLHATVLPRRAVQIDMTYGGVTETRFAGWIDEVAPTSGLYEERKVTLTCSDAMALLTQGDGQIALAVDVYADEIIEDVVDAVYTPAATNYEEGLNLFPVSADRWAWKTIGQAVEEVKASSKIGDVCLADWGSFFIARDGTPTFLNRHHMPLDAATVLTLDGLMTGLSYRLGVTSAYNVVEVTCHPRTVGTVNEVLGAIEQDRAPAIEATAAVTFVIKFRDPSNQKIQVGGRNVITPVATTDYICTSDQEGEGADMTGSVTAAITRYGDHAVVTLTNAAASRVYIQKLQVRGLAVRAREPVTIAVEDAASIAAYQRRSMQVDAVLMSAQAEAQALADYLLDRYKDPAAVIDGISFTANRNATLMAAARDLELCERVEISEGQTGLSSYTGYIWNLAEMIVGATHTVTFGLVEAYDVGTPFRLDTSALNSGHVLIY